MTQDKEQVRAMGVRFDAMVKKSEAEQAQGLLHGVTPEVGICWTHSEMRLTFNRMISEEERELLGRLMTIAIKGYHDAKAQANVSVSETQPSIPADHCAYCKYRMRGGPRAYFCEELGCPARGIDQYPSERKPQREAAGIVADQKPPETLIDKWAQRAKYVESIGAQDFEPDPETAPSVTSETKRWDGLTQDAYERRHAQLAAQHLKSDLPGESRYIGLTRHESEPAPLRSDWSELDFESRN